MSWYKQAKLIDKQTNPDDKSIHSVCSYCERWAIHGDGREDWKFYDELQDQDKFVADETKKGISGNHYVSHGICPDCWGNMEVLSEKGVDAYSLGGSFYKKLVLYPEQKNAIMQRTIEQRGKRRKNL